MDYASLLDSTDVISLDFSKAFDTVRHSSLLNKPAQLDFPDHIYNLLADVFYNHSHCTLFHDQQSSLLDNTASIIQGSAIEPAAYVVTAGDLTAAVSGNSLCKFANDINLIIYQPPVNPLVISSMIWSLSVYRNGPSGIP